MNSIYYQKESASITNEPGTRLESDYENMLERFQNLSLYPTTEDELLYIRQRISSISVWETRMCIRADSVLTREESIKIR